MQVCSSWCLHKLKISQETKLHTHPGALWIYFIHFGCSHTCTCRNQQMSLDSFCIFHLIQFGSTQTKFQANQNVAAKVMWELSVHSLVRNPISSSCPQTFEHILIHKCFFLNCWALKGISSHNQCLPHKSSHLWSVHLIPSTHPTSVCGRLYSVLFKNTVLSKSARMSTGHILKSFCGCTFAHFARCFNFKIRFKKII